jgi:hypothetical protein
MNRRRISLLTMVVLVTLSLGLIACVPPTPTSTSTPAPTSTPVPSPTPTLQVDLVCAPDTNSTLIAQRQTAALSINVSGGTDETTYAWQAERGNVQSDNGRATYTPPDSPGKDTVEVTVTRNGQTITRSCTYNIVEIKPLAFQQGLALPSWWVDHYCSAPYGDKSILAIANLGADSVQLVPTWYQQNLNASEVYTDSGKTTSDECLIHAIRAAHNNGLAVMLKPHVDPVTGYRGEIAPTYPITWFTSYQQMMLHYADIARNNEVEVFVVGTELKSMSEAAYTDQWRALIKEIRNRYPGWLTYAANWSDYDAIRFWDALDYMGIDAYFPLSQASNPSREEILTGWQIYTGTDAVHNWADELLSAAKANDKRVIFTEIGYASQDGAAQKPWSQDVSTQPNPQLQARLYEAALQTFWPQQDFKGLYWWLWDMKISPQYQETGYMPKAAAQEELRRWYQLTPPDMPPTPTPEVLDTPTPAPSPTAAVKNTPPPAQATPAAPPPAQAAPAAPPSTGFGWETCTVDKWVAQTYTDSQGFASIEGTPEIAHTGKCALKLNARLQGQHANFSKGETLVTLPQAISLNGKSLTCWVYAPSAEAAGQANKPNGAQIFVKDASAEYKSEYSSWVNLAANTWNSVTLPPGGGSMDAGFDPTNIKMIGVKIGTSGEAPSDYVYNGPYYVDDCHW